MNLKRVAGIVNIVAAAILISVGTANDRTVLIVIGGIFLLLGFIRLKQNPPGPPAP